MAATGEFEVSCSTRPKAIRAISSKPSTAAVDANPFPILIPTHCVVGSDGSISGYGSAVPIKGGSPPTRGVRPGGPEAHDADGFRNSSLEREQPGALHRASFRLRFPR